METMLLLVLLAYASGNPEAKESLRSFLSFYRENRDVFAMLVQKDAPISNSAPSAEEKNRPQAEAGNMKIIEEYLSKLG